MPVYNTEPYLELAIDSVIHQTIGFEENIQLIIINDGSTDNSGEICLKYAAKYKDNIYYKKKDNGGASSSRNAGMEYIQGKYVNFMDSDDMWVADAFKKAYDFFEDHYEEIDILSCRLKYFELRTDRVHPLDYKYEKGDRIISLQKEWDGIQLGNGNVFFKSEALKNIRYNIDLIVSEDARLIGQLALNKSKEGVLASAIYKYRKRLAGDSLMDKARMEKSWYFDVPVLYHRSLMDISKEIYGKIPKYIQYMVAYELQARLNQTYDEISNVLLPEEIEKYIELMRMILQDVDDNVIYKLRNKKMPFKAFLFQFKYGYNILENAKLTEKGILIFNRCKVFNLNSPNRYKISRTEIKDDIMTIEGTTDIILLGEKYKLYVETSNKELVQVELNLEAKNERIGITGQAIPREVEFTVDVPVGIETIFKFVVQKNR